MKLMKCLILVLKNKSMKVKRDEITPEDIKQEERDAIMKEFRAGYA